MMEIWKDVIENPIYQISSFGNVRKKTGDCFVPVSVCINKTNQYCYTHIGKKNRYRNNKWRYSNENNKNTES